MKKNTKRNQKRTPTMLHEWNPSGLSMLMLKAIKSAAQHNEIGWTIQFHNMRCSIRIDAADGGFLITAIEDGVEHVARITRKKKSYMISGNEILFQRILQRKLEI